MSTETITLTVPPPPTALTISTNQETIDNADNQTHNPSRQEQGLANGRPSGKVITLVMMPLCLSVLLSSLDLTMVTPAVPAISSSFRSSNGYVWVGGAFVLASTAVTPVWGSLADIWGRKPIMLASQVLFFAGSLICALASTMNALILGRAVQGLGASGMGTMVNTIICDTFSMRDRGLYLAITSVIWAVGSGVGPVIGGVFTTKADWRWCFWMNLPIGAVVFVALLLYLHVPTPRTPVLAGLKAIDWTGSLLIIGATLMVLLGLQFGDVIFPWSSATVICLIIFGFVTLGVFIANEWKLASNPVIPLRLFSSVSTVAAYGVYVCTFSVLVGLSYYLPLYSQAVLGVNALESGVHLLPLIVSSSLAAACTGVFIQKTGIYLQFMYCAQVLLTLGSGLLINLGVEQNLTKLVIYQIVAGVGIGMNMEPPLLAAQAASTAIDTAAIIATMGFLRSIATGAAIVIGGVIFQNLMNAENSRIAALAGEQIASTFSGDHATQSIDLIADLATGNQSVVKEAYARALRGVWIMCVAIAGISFVLNFFVRAHYLSVDTDATVLGVDRRDQLESVRQEQRASSSGSRPVELGDLRGNGIRQRT